MLLEDGEERVVVETRLGRDNDLIRLEVFVPARHQVDVARRSQNRAVLDPDFVIHVQLGEGVSHGGPGESIGLGPSAGLDRPGADGRQVQVADAGEGGIADFHNRLIPTPPAGIILLAQLDVGRGLGDGDESATVQLDFIERVGVVQRGEGELARVPRAPELGEGGVVAHRDLGLFDDAGLAPARGHVHDPARAGGDVVRPGGLVFRRPVLHGHDDVVGLDIDCAQIHPNGRIHVVLGLGAAPADGGRVDAVGLGVDPGLVLGREIQGFHDDLLTGSVAQADLRRAVGQRLGPSRRGRVFVRIDGEDATATRFGIRVGLVRAVGFDAELAGSDGDPVAHSGKGIAFRRGFGGIPAQGQDPTVLAGRRGSLLAVGRGADFHVAGHVDRAVVPEIRQDGLGGVVPVVPVVLVGLGAGSIDADDAAAGRGGFGLGGVTIGGLGLLRAHGHVPARVVHQRNGQSGLAAFIHFADRGQGQHLSVRRDAVNLIVAVVGVGSRDPNRVPRLEPVLEPTAGAAGEGVRRGPEGFDGHAVVGVVVRRVRGRQGEDGRGPGIDQIVRRVVPGVEDSDVLAGLESVADPAPAIPRDRVLGTGAGVGEGQ